MQKPQFLTAKSILIAFALIAVLAISTALLHAQTGPETNDQFTGQSEAQSESQNSRGSLKEAQAQRVEGSWHIVVTPAVPPGIPQPPSFNVYGTFARGNAFIGSDRAQPLPQHGVWQHLGGNRFAYTFKQDTRDGMGNFTGVFQVNVQFHLTRNDVFVGAASGVQRDPNGNVVVIRCATIRGTRIKVEPLACP